MQAVTTIQHSHPLELGPLELSSLNTLLTERYQHSRKIILVDENTHDHCLEFLLTSFTHLEQAEVMLLPAGEENKVLEVCSQVWDAFTEYRISRQDLVINLGGGVVTDMGGMIAALYKRGMDFIHIPTSLLAMVDASLGGKTGIDFGGFKNQLGVFAQPKGVYIDPRFLQSLPEDELASGFAEMLKHGLIADADHWHILLKKGWKNLEMDDLIRSISIKKAIVDNDPLERGERKKLNLGHTVGHALEGLLLDTDNAIKHGHAVAIGMLVESHLALQYALLNEADFADICTGLLSYYEIPDFSELDFDLVISWMQQDKKNNDENILAVLPEGLGNCRINVPIFPDDIEQAFNWLNAQRLIQG